jgi:hypothetical protein
MFLSLMRSLRGDALFCPGSAALIVALSVACRDL